MVIENQNKWWIQNRLESTYQDSQKEPSVALQSEERLAEIDSLLGRRGTKITDTEQFKNIIDNLILNTRTDSNNAVYEFSEATRSFPNIAKHKNDIKYEVFGRDIAAQPIYWETFLLGLGGRGVSATSTFIETNSSKAIAKVAGNEIAKNIAIGTGANASLQLASGQSFNWYELAGARASSAITPNMSIKNAIRTNMGISMGVSLVSDGNPLTDTGLAGVGTWAGSKINSPIFSVMLSESIQKMPDAIDKISSPFKQEVEDEK